MLVLTFLCNQNDYIFTKPRSLVNQAFLKTFSNYQPNDYIWGVRIVYRESRVFIFPLFCNLLFKKS